MSVKYFDWALGTIEVSVPKSTKMSDEDWQLVESVIQEQNEEVILSNQCFCNRIIVEYGDNKKYIFEHSKSIEKFGVRELTSSVDTTDIEVVKDAAKRIIDCNKPLEQ